jgi:hypothetical protein
MTSIPTLPTLREQVAELRAAGKGNPRVHPNGFIQLDLDHVADGWHASHHRGHSGGRTRLHIWNPPGVTLPHQDTVNEIHDHVFDMLSTVMIGALEQQLYEFVPGRDDGDIYERYTAVYQKGADSRLQPTGERGVLELVESLTVKAGQSYTQPAFTLHDSLACELVVTIMEKTEIHEGDATVICPVDQPPDNSFDRASALPADEVWRAILVSLA